MNSVTVNVGPLNALADRMRGKMSVIVRETAFEVEARAKLMCPVDTGALRASIFTVTDKGSNQSKAVAEAAAKNPKAPLASIPELIADELNAYVAVGMGYGIYVEYGTGRAKAQPFLIPAVEQVAPKFRERIAKALTEGLV